MSKKSYLIMFYEINISQATMFRLYTVYKKHEMIKTGNQKEKNLKYSNNFVFDYMWFSRPDWVYPIEMGGASVFANMKKNGVLSK